MIVSILVVPAILTYYLITLIYRLVIKRNRRNLTKHWQVGDLLIPTDRAYIIRETLTKSKRVYMVLLGWNERKVYVELEKGMVHEIEYPNISSNKAAIWRKNFEDSKKYMGNTPGFQPGLGDNVTQVGNTTNKTFHGKSIDLLTETECNIYLKEALDNEDYETAELIKERLEKFR